MKITRINRLLTLLFVVGAVLAPKPGFTQIALESTSGVDTAVELGYDYFWVKGDKGRFREDNWMSSDASYGLKYFLVENFNDLDIGEDDYYYRLEGNALYNYDYDLSFLALKEDNHYIKFDASSMRRFFDGSNEFWDESLYGFPGADPRGTSEHPDDDLFVDRRNYNLEFGWTPASGAEAILGWKRLERDGTDTLLRGSRARVSGDPIPRFRGIPALSTVNGVTDTYYLELANIISEKYNVRFRQEYEEYNDDQQIVFPRYKDGVLEQDRRYYDKPKYTLSTSLLMFDTYLDDKTYVTANYMYSDLENNTSRMSVRPNLSKPNHFIDNVVSSRRTAHVGGVAMRKADFLKKHLTLSAGIRLEDSQTNSEGSGLGSPGAATLREAMTDLGKVKVSEILRLVYKGWENAVVTFDADLEQTESDWSEYEDVRSHEIFNKPDAQVGGIPAGVDGILERVAEIEYMDQEYELKTVFRNDSNSRTTISYKYKDLDREYDEILDNDPLYYPGNIGAYDIKGSNFTVRKDWGTGSSINTVLLYKYIDETVDTLNNGQTQDLSIQRLSGSASGALSKKIFLTGSLMYEEYQLDTPAVGIGTTIKSASADPTRYDFSGDNYTALVNGSYIFGKDDQHNCIFGFQHTETIGTGSDTTQNGSSYDKISLTFRMKVKEGHILSLGYRYIDFDNEAGDRWDDYTANGALVSYAFRY